MRCRLDWPASKRRFSACCNASGKRQLAHRPPRLMSRVREGRASSEFTDVLVNQRTADRRRAHRVENWRSPERAALTNGWVLLTSMQFVG
jgi:hypothetical protein